MQTPIGAVPFTNLIYTHDPSAPRRFVIAAHFDSKWFPKAPQSGFIGATDSAAPCAMMMDLAEALTPLLDARRARILAGGGLLEAGFDEEEAGETTLQLWFLDGEEAFHDWTDTDSTYGARLVSHLSPLGADWRDTSPSCGTQPTSLHRIPSRKDGTTPPRPS